MTLLTAAAAVTLFRKLAWCAVVLALGLVALRIWTEQAVLIFVCATGGMSIVAALLLPRRERDAR